MADRTGNRTTGLTPDLLVECKEPRRGRRWRLRLGSPALNALMLVSGAAFAWVHALPTPATQYPLQKTLEVPTERELILIAADGKPFARRGGCFDSPVSLDEVPRHFVDALLATEDRRFHSHFGIDPIGVARAALFNYGKGRVVQGGSTLTQQLAKMSYLTGAKTFARKLEEAVIALRLETGLTKDQILQRYLSRAYFGEGCYGLRGAARHYFGRRVDELTLSQSSHLVALLRSPTALANSPEALHRRQKLVLRGMVADGRLAEAELARIEPAKRRADRVHAAGAYYADWVASTVELPDDGQASALPVHTSYQPALQQIAEQAVQQILRRSGGRLRARQAALVAMRPDGRILAMVGGVDHGESQFNRATQALRQPGSSFKAFVYLAALRAGARPDMLVYDEPITIGEWSPENYGRSYRGLVSLQQAFSSSINTVAVRVSEAVGRERVAAAARDLGITTSRDVGPSIALGTSEVTLLQLTSAYAAFAADAYPVKPWGVVSLGEGGSRKGRPPRDAGRWRLTSGDMMRQLLEATVQHGTGRAARLPVRSYGKTGTSQNYRDAWFVGFAGNLVVGVWVGNDDNTPMRRVTGGNLPTQIWHRFVSRARLKDRRFRPGLQRVAAFRAARPRRLSRYADAGDLGSLLMYPNERYAMDAYGNRFWGNPMMLGQPAPETEYPRPARRERRRSGPAGSLGSWVSGLDGS